MLNISLKDNPDFYSKDSVEKCLFFLKNINENDFLYPKDITYFHTSTEFKTVKEQMVLKSYIATQNLDHTHMIVWSDYDISNMEFLKPYLKYITLKVYDPIEEAKGTILENNKWLLVKDSKHYMQSGILRFLVLNKYGGIWSDMDMIFLRDLKPILDQEFAYMWQTFTDFAKLNTCFTLGPCAAFMNIHKNSEHSNLCLQEIIKTNINPNSTCLDEDLLAKVYRIKPFTVFPSVFFNTEWQMETNAEQMGWFIKNNNSDKLFLEAFSWHWHNTSNKNKEINEGSKFSNLMKIIDKKLKDKNLI